MAAKTMTRRQQLQSLVAKIASISDECQSEVDCMAIERDKALAEAGSRVVDCALSGDEITAEGLAEFLEYRERNLSWCASYGRLLFWCRVDGSWGLYFDSTIGGSIGSYRKLKTMNEVKLLIELLGVMKRDQMNLMIS